MVLLTSFLEKANLFVNNVRINNMILYIALSLITVLAYSILAYRLRDRMMKLFYGFLSLSILVAIYYTLNYYEIPLFIRIIMLILMFLSIVNLFSYLLDNYKQKCVMSENHEMIIDYYDAYRHNYLIEYVPIKKQKTF